MILDFVAPEQARSLASAAADENSRELSAPVRLDHQANAYQ